MKNFIRRKKQMTCHQRNIFLIQNLINDKEKLDCDGEVTDTECSETIGNMKLNKSPGLDGLTVEFYRAFWRKLKIVLTDIYNKSYNEALMSYSQRSSIVSLLFKKGILCVLITIVRFLF
jgi:hypothetical protein